LASPMTSSMAMQVFALVLSIMSIV
jgi:hypothetical protein